MATVAGLLATMGVLGLIGGLVLLIWRPRWAPRQPVVAVIGGSLAVMLLAGAIDPTRAPPGPQPGGPAAAQAIPATAVGSPSRQSLDEAFTAAQAALFAAARPCDAALAKAAHTHGQYASYNVSMLAKQACFQAGLDIGQVVFSDPLPKSAQDDLNAAVQCFSLAYTAKSTAMEEAAGMLDSGDERPSNVAAFRSDLADAGQQHRACMEQYALAAMKNGFAKEIGAVDKD